MKIYLFLVAFFLISLTMVSCNKSEDNYSTASITDYNPSIVGKYITYQLDSLVYISFGTRDTTISNEVKYLTDAAITDNLGRPSFRIIRFIRKTNLDAWAPDASFMVTNTINTLEFIENNLRYIKLAMPIRLGYSWKGNSYIDTYSANSTLKYLDNWDYSYSDIGVSGTIGTFSLDNILTVDQRDEIVGNPNDPASYSEINYCQEKYAKGIGMVYRKFFHNEYQPGGNGYFADGSYGVTYTMIDHN